VPRGFVLITPPNWLPHLPRFLKAVEIRLNKLTDAGLAKDLAAMQTIAPLWQRYADRSAELSRRGICDPHLQTYRWMLEELRVSLFAQELKTSMPVSVQRLDRQWALVQK